MSAESLRDRLNNIESQIIETESRKKRFEEFESINVLFVASQSDKELALWQSKYPPDSPQHIIANHEWQRRLNVEQIKSNRFSAYVGIAGVILGFLLSSSLEIYKDAVKVSEASKTESQSAQEIKNIVKPPENIITQIKDPTKEPINHESTKK